MTADDVHSYTRLFHVGPEVEVIRRNGSFELSGRHFTGLLTNSGPTEARQHVVRGQTSPEMKGWTFPTYRSSHEIYVVELASEGTRSLLSTVIGLTEKPVKAQIASTKTDGFTFEIRGADF